MLRAALAALALVAAPPPQPTAPVPLGPQALAQRITVNETGLRTALEAWTDRDEPAPEAVVLHALYQQRAARALAHHPDLLGPTTRRLSPARRRAYRRLARSLRDIRILNAGHRPHRIRTGPPPPAAELRRHYRAAQRRFGVGWHVLAAVNLVESQFGRLRNDSVAGAQGPMQFIPATWAAYGLGGDVHDPRDAVMGAANYLHANGAPGDYARALFRYNPSSLYVRAVRGYARAIAEDPDAFPALYNWQAYVRDRRLTGPR